MPRKKKRNSRTVENISLIDNIKKSKAYIFLTTLFLFSVTLFGAFYQPFTDAMKGVWSDDSRIEHHFGKAEKIKKSFKLEESNNVG